MFAARFGRSSLVLRKAMVSMMSLNISICEEDTTRADEIMNVGTAENRNIYFAAYFPPPFKVTNLLRPTLDSLSIFSHYRNPEVARLWIFIQFVSLHI
ncbi:hypothetical protein BJ875DRAFT_458515 [Amylocarpus encephaloides]|uniref:Uncharacterized protein n=1 Tax=Amylocarpus encephaloides TaxID=45428 RepID=A0A9P7YM25_9HELO|nr:hypothetical protein BJ875DRAFT_458515 [Amylocarpus encephaloides]